MSVALEVDSLLNQLVGTPELEVQTEAELTTRIFDDIAAGIEPYDTLESRAFQAIYEIIAPTMVEPVILDDVGVASAYDAQQAIREWDKTPHQSSDHDKGTTMQNALSGAHFFARGLAALGRIYEATAKEPQDLRNVERNTGRVLRHYQRIAFSDRLTGGVSIDAMNAGADPRTSFDTAVIKDVSEDSFIMTVKGGQLDVDIRYKDLAKPVTGKVCPATAVRVQGTETPTRSGLLVFGQLLGRISVNPILATTIVIRM